MNEYGHDKSSSRPVAAGAALDHLVYATPGLEESVQGIAEGLGIQPSEGGRHVGWGSRNYLLGLGGGSYLELIGRDPEQPDFAGTRPFDLESLTEARLVGWAVRVVGITDFVEKLRAAGHDPGPIREMSRRTPQGQELHWKLTQKAAASSPSLIPFFIDWGDTPHPSQTAAQGARLEAFRLQTPNSAPLEDLVDRLGLPYPVETADHARLVAKIAGPAGELTLS